MAGAAGRCGPERALVVMPSLAEHAMVQCRPAPPCASLLLTEGYPNALLFAAVRDSSSLPSISAATLLMGCARLGRRPGPKVRQLCWEVVVSPEGLRSNRQGLPNAAWALAVLEVRCRAEL